MRRRVAIVGYGYVGRGMYDLLHRHHEVSVYDAYVWPHNEEARRSEVQKCDLAIVCVPTPSMPDGSCDVSKVAEVVGWLECPLICVKSTVPPGTCDRLARETGKAIHFSPEYMGEGRNFTAPWKYPDPRDARSHEYAIVGGPRASEVLEFFAAVMATDAHYVSTDARTAELAKYMENCWLAAKVTFCAEFADIARAYGIDWWRLREIWCLDPRVGADHTLVFRDSPGFDGKCLPKDTAALVAAAETVGVSPRLMRAVVETNREIRAARSDVEASAVRDAE